MRLLLRGPWVEVAVELPNAMRTIQDETVAPAAVELARLHSPRLWTSLVVPGFLDKGIGADLVSERVMVAVVAVVVPEPRVQTGVAPMAEPAVLVAPQASLDGPCSSLGAVGELEICQR